MPTLRSGRHTKVDSNDPGQEHSSRAATPVKKCTYDLGYIRQAVYLCVTCTPIPETDDNDGDEPLRYSRGVCKSCSIVCHGRHRLVALHHKRHFRCDCCTAGVEHPCSLEEETYEPNGVVTTFDDDREQRGNKYDQNFRGRFCRCARASHISRDTMVQCLNCEDWFHESCLNAGSSDSDSDSDKLGETDPEITPSNALLPQSAYETLICGSCVLDNPTLRRYAGTRNVRMIARQPGSDWVVLDGDDVVAGKGITHQNNPRKRNRLDEVDGREAKKVRMEHVERSSGQSVSSDDFDAAISTSGCCAPVPHPIAIRVLTNLASDQYKHGAIDARQKRDEAVQQTLAEGEETDMCLLPQEDKGIGDGAVPDLDEVEKAGGEERQTWEGRGDIFLTKGWRKRWCHCLSCLPSLEGQPYLLYEEETYG